MLILGRRLDERIIICLPDGRRVTVTFVGMSHGGQVRLGFEAPEDVEIDREEIRRDKDLHPGVNGKHEKRRRLR